jgi:hypothetical protein
MLFTHEANANNQHSSCPEMDLRGTSSNSCVIGKHSSLEKQDVFLDVVSNLCPLQGFGKENIYGKSEETSFGNSLKDGSAVSPGNFSFSWLSGDDFQSATLDHDKRPLSDTRPCQTACKRPKQADNDTWLYSFEEHPFSNALKISTSGFYLSFCVQCCN